MKRSKLDVLFEDLPVLLVDSWDQLTPELLQQTKLFLSYWSNLIKSHCCDVRVSESQASEGGVREEKREIAS